MTAGENVISPKTEVNIEKGPQSLKKLITWVNKSLLLRNKIGSTAIDIGFFANVLNLGHEIGLAISTDGVGTKVIVAQMMNKYDTIGIDCIAMNVNDLICVGAEPISLVDYLAVQSPKPDLLEQIGKGLYEGARQAKITIPGGELAQLRDVITGAKDGYGFDLVGTAVGLVPLKRIIVGQDIREKDVIIGLRSSGVHSNGFTLARKIFFEAGRYKIDSYSEELGCTIGEELLKPTHIYVPEVMEMIQTEINIKALLNITGDGLMNIRRVKSETGYIIDHLPEPNPVFPLMQKTGSIDDAEMFSTFNMGIGFCIVCPESEMNKVTKIADKYQVESFRMGYAVRDTERRIKITEKKLVSKGSRFCKI